MRIALLADVHANLPALDAVLIHARERRVSEFWDLGDMVGYGPFPGECIARLRATCARHILGNHDEKCTTLAHSARMRERNGDPDKIFSFEWTCRQLTANEVRFIHGLPKTVVLTVDGQKILLAHGSPVHSADSLTPRTPAEKFQSLLPVVRDAGAGLMVCGHTHEFFDRSFDGVRFVNPGGIGRSFDGDPRASYVILDITAKGVRVEHFRVAYDLNRLTDALRAQKFPERLVRTFIEARNIEELAGFQEAEVPVLHKATLLLGKKFCQHESHSRQVARLSGFLFDGFAAYFGLGWRERAWLLAAAGLHDIGWVYGAEGHHKASRDLILKDTLLPLSDRERLIIALIARYHRRSCPQPAHAHFRDLNPYEQETVSVLAGILRIADGLDRSHEARVAGLEVAFGRTRITLRLAPFEAANLAAEIDAATQKADLLQGILGRQLIISS